MCVGAHVWRSEDSLYQLVLPFHHVSPGDQAQSLDLVVSAFTRQAQTFSLYKSTVSGAFGCSYRKQTKTLGFGLILLKVFSSQDRFFFPTCLVA